MWRFFGVLCLLLLPCATEKIRDCPENKVCVNFVADTCSVDGGEKVWNECHALLWTENYNEHCESADINTIVALIDFEVIDPYTWSTEIAVWENIFVARFIFDGANVTFDASVRNSAAITAIFSWGTENARLPVVALPKIELSWGRSVPRYAFNLTANGEKLLDLIGGSVTYKGKDSRYRDGSTLTDSRFAQLLRNKTHEPAAIESPTPMGAIVGGVVGGVLLLIGLIIAACFIWRWYKRNYGLDDYFTNRSSSSKAPTPVVAPKKQKRNIKSLFTTKTDIERLHTEKFSKFSTTDRAVNNHFNNHVEQRATPPKTPYANANRNAASLDPESLYENYVPSPRRK